MTISSANKYATVIAVLLITACGPAAAAIHSGSYHSVASKSSWSNGQFPSNFSLTIDVQFKDGKLVYHSVNDHSSAANLD
jgi:hypothetical protein